MDIFRKKQIQQVSAELECFCGHLLEGPAGYMKIVRRLILELQSDLSMMKEAFAELSSNRMPSSEKSESLDEDGGTDKK